MPVLRHIVAFSLGAWSASSASCGAAGGCDVEDMSALQSLRASTQPEGTPAPTPGPTPGPTPTPCKKSMQYCSDICEAFNCEDTRLQCERLETANLQHHPDERYCRWHWSSFQNVMEQVGRDGVCEPTLVQAGAEETLAKVDSKEASGPNCKSRSYYCVRVCSAFPSLDWLQGVDCQERCRERFGKFRKVFKFYKEHGICSWYDEEDDTEDNDS